MKSMNILQGALIAASVATMFACGSKPAENKTKPADTKTDNTADSKAAEPTADSKPAEANPTAASTPASTSAAPAGDKVHCLGINECKGKGACGAADGSHTCAGKNECKGKGWVEVTAADCTAKGGTVAAK